jgi:hypothetical protein
MNASSMPDWPPKRPPIQMINTVSSANKTVVLTLLLMLDKPPFRG